MLLSDHCDAYPLVCQCIRWMLVYGTNSAACERRFSLTNRVKTKLRTSLTRVTLSDIMHISANPISENLLDHRRVMEEIATTSLSTEL